MNIMNLSALEIAQKIANKEITSVDVVQFYIDRIHALSHLNSISELFETEALEQARQKDLQMESGICLSPFHGIPILLKDNLDVKGHITHAGTVYLNDIAQQSCELVLQLECLGFVILGKTKMTELAFGLSGQNPMQGTPMNPWSAQQLSPGGSSSGSAVAVAAGLSPLAIGGDTGGSIRTPAALNGIFGFKPSSHKIADQGAVPLSASLDTLGPFSRFAEDITVLYQLLSASSCESEQETDVIYYLDEASFPFPLEAQILAIWRNFLHRLEVQGFKLLPWAVPKSFDFQDLSDRTSDIIAYESYLYHGEKAEDLQATMWELVRQRVLRGKEISQRDYETLIQEREKFQLLFKQSLHGRSLLFPVSPFFALVSSQEDTEFTHVGEYTRPFNYLDAPSYAFPVGSSQVGLPMGLQLVSHQGNDCAVVNTVQKIAQSMTIQAPVAPLCIHEV
ncbi:hypothetical protein B9T31_12840 [Acinetobacter sp. ANC 4558]|uniref:amidase n=1 Tax=Acinetobacter sp. ANC 4558 TaxID=1977876 RepID=UPI000A32D808|nr:amidase [Acinetobacter sp. ANC 4558]OTG85353.1 hypothetical protein B9T31_12840 [Acinetobacter sp. ANC 4558]